MRVVVTGASGFVGSNVARLCRDYYGDDVIDTRVDLNDTAAIRAHVAAISPDGVIHSAIVNDWDRLLADRRAAWRAYVDATAAYAEAAAEVGATFVLVSTDWVFDGTQGPAKESEPPNPVNFYGFLKAAAELTALERGGAVARVSGVNGQHWDASGQARHDLPRAQDHGFGYFVASLVDAAERREPFTVWTDDDIGPGGLNTAASPSLASMCGDVMRRIVKQQAPGIFHCCGAEAASRRQLAAAAVRVFDLDPELVRFGPPPSPAPWPIPNDTSLDATATAKRLGYELPTIDTLLEAFRQERETGNVTSTL